MANYQDCRIRCSMETAKQIIECDDGYVFGGIFSMNKALGVDDKIYLSTGISFGEGCPIYRTVLGSGAVMPTSGQSSSGNADASSTPYTSLTGSSGSGITNTSTNQGRSYTGAYILAAAAAAVIIGAIAVMALYMRGKISLGKFEQILGGEQSSDNNGDGDEFYNPDDFKDT